MYTICVPKYWVVDAALIFETDTMEWIDDREDHGEERVIALGLSGLTVLRVTYTLRGASIRIVSAQSEQT